MRKVVRGEDPGDEGADMQGEEDAEEVRDRPEEEAEED